MQPLSPTSPLTALPGIGKTRAEAFAHLGIHTLYDLLFHFPRAYENRGDLHLLKDGADGQVGAFLLTVATTPQNARLRGRMTLTKFRAFDDSGSAEVVFFNQPYLRETFRPSQTYRFYGKLCRRRTGVQLSSPKYEKWDENAPLPDFHPVYPLSEGLTPRMVAEAAEAALAALLPTLRDPLPEDIRREAALPTLATALRYLHQPTDRAELEKGARRMAFDEMFTFGLCAGAAGRQAVTHAPRMRDTDLSPLLSRLPYQLTASQEKVVSEICRDLSNEKEEAMRRILIGDVGSGKTVCAALAIYCTVKNGYQAALMVPTEILARQHYQELAPLFEALGFSVGLLVGSCSAKEKAEVRRCLNAPEGERLSLLIGTHALLEEGVVFSALALTVTDEQHRFGVMQRAALQKKGQGAHLLVMSATPIPRTLALTLYGDLAVSRIEQMPAGRQKVSTFVLDDSYRPRLYGFLREQVRTGGRVYMVCPAIEDKEEAEDEEISLSDLLQQDAMPPLRSAEGLVRSLREEIFPDIPIGYLHGRMRGVDKDAEMRRFATGETKILVSTTVIEVGVNVPEATVMVVENAERFGLSQLHQLRGRVGRGSRKSYCFLLSQIKSGPAYERLQTMHTTYDGYEIAKADLAQRGPGDFFSSLGAFRQSGSTSFEFAHAADTALMEQAFAAAGKVLQQDPALSLPEHAALREKVAPLLQQNADTVS